MSNNNQENNVTLQTVTDRITAFSNVTFGENRPFTAPLNHLKKEVVEAIESGSEEEYADMLLLLLDSYRMRFPNTKIQQLIEAADNKIGILKTRTWQKPDRDGVIEHVR